MALVTVSDPVGVFYPTPFPSNNVSGTVSISNLTHLQLSGTTRVKVAWMGRILVTGTINQMHFYSNTRVGTEDVKVSFQDLSAGVPDGTVDQFRVLSGAGIAGSSWIATGLITSDGTDGGTKRSVTRGDALALVWEWDSTQSGVLSVAGAATSGNPWNNYPYVASHNGTVWAKNFSAGYPSVVLEYSDGSFATLNGAWPAVPQTTSFASNSTPDERALYFSLTAPVRVGGVWVWADLNAAADVVLYDTDGSTALATVSLDVNEQVVTNPAFWPVMFPTPVTLAASSFYRIALKPTTTTAVGLTESVVNAAGHAQALPGGQFGHLSTRTDAGAWSETTTNVPMIGLIIDQIDNGTGGGGGGGSYVFVG